MGKSLVERYEQILAQDPTSSVFVELAKALLEKGETARAIAVCESGLLHHPRSVTGRVLWGKALIQLGKPAQAMEQFDQAIAIDKDNAHAYNLISEVLLQKGLFRSALPLLRKASALQPGDARVKSWLEQTQQALAGGPAPTISDFTLAAPADPPAESAPVAPAPPPVAPPEEATPPPAPGPAAAARPPGARPGGPPVLAAVEPAAPPPSLVIDPALLAEAQPGDEPAGEPSPPAEERAGPPVLTADGAAEPAPARGGLLEDLPPPEEAAPPPQAAHPPPPPAPRGLLGDIPELVEATDSSGGRLESTQAAQVVAAQYEKELREKLEASRTGPTFWQKNAIKLASAAVVLISLVVGGAVFLNIRGKTNNLNLAGMLKAASQQIAKDTVTSYRQARSELALAVDLDSGSTEAWALTAYSAALLFAEHGRGSDDRRAAEEALGRKDVAERFPGHALAARYLIADAKAREGLRREVLDSKVDAAEVHELAGRILMGTGRGEARPAVERYKKALELNGRNVRALVAMADYYREADDHPSALKFYEAAAGVSPDHPGRVIGWGESILETSGDVAAALAAVEKLVEPESLSPDLLGRKELVHGRLLSASGRHDLALLRLGEGARAFRALGFEFQLALGQANRAAGKLAAAEQAFEAALKLRPRSEEAREELARALLARDREREVLSRFPSEEGARKVSLVRGIAHARLGEWKKARAELVRTEVAGRFPSEAVAYLALADAAEGEPERAQEVLEKALAATRRPRPFLRLALGNVYWQRGLLDKARAQFEAALEDPTDHEGGCALGRLLIRTGETDRAIEALAASVRRNGAHAESRRALIRAQLAAGRHADALKEAQAWVLDNPTAPSVQKDFALAQLFSGKLKEAEAAIDRAVRSDPRDAEAFRIRAQILFARGDLKTGFSALQRANKLNPKDPETFCEIGRAFLRQGKKDLAEAAFGAAEREDEDSYCAAIGLEAIDLPAGSRAAAKELLQLAAAAPSSWDRVNARALASRALLGAGALKDARKEAEEAVLAGPTSAQAQYALGLAALRGKDLATATAAFSRAVQLDAGDPEILLALADALAASDAELPRAVAAYEAFLRLGADGPQLSRVRKALPGLRKKAAGP